MKAIVTVKLPRNPRHNSRNKRTGVCPLFRLPYKGWESRDDVICTDITGSHHSYIETGRNVKEIREKAEERFGHVTRIEIQ